MTVVKVILVPLVLGLLAHRVVGENHLADCNKFLVLLSAFSVLSILGGVIAVNGARIVSYGGFLVALVLLHSLLGYALGYVASAFLGMKDRQRHTVSIEVGMQNDALAISLAAVYFNPLVAVPAAIGAAVHQVTGSLLAGVYASYTREPRLEKAQVVPVQAE